ncbi:MAG TPA: kelch repeat-containing protein, partial [Polyangiaceae bacterium]
MRKRDWRAGTIRCALAGAFLFAGACADGESPDRQRDDAIAEVASSAHALSAWESIPLAGRSEHGAVALDHDRVLVCGGLSEAWTDLSDCRILNADSGSSTAGPALPLPRRFMTLTRLSQTEPWPVLLVGGGQSPNLVANALVGTEAGWVSEPALRRRYHTATRLYDGSVLVVGGDNHAAAFVSEVQRRTPNGTWMDAGQQERLLHAAVVVNTEEGEGVLAVGGFDLAENALGSMDLYEVDANRWSTAGTLPEPRGWATATALDDGWVLIVGGVGSMRSIRPYPGALLFNVNTGEWSPANQGVSLVPRMKHQAARIGRYVVVAGGLTEGPNQNTISLSSVQVFDIETKTWADLLPMTNARSLFELTALEGRLVASGGEGAIGSAEVLEPLSLGSSCESGVECVSGHCEGAVCCESACSGACSTCNGETPGECVVVEEGTPPETLACDGYTCSAGECQDRCERDADCIASHFCQNGACVERQDLGDPCERAEQCGDGLSCTDGVCCETECGGQCEF